MTDTDNQQPNVELERKCRVCGEVKPIDQFAIVYSQKLRGKQYRQHSCIVCYRKKCADKERRLRAKNPEAYRAANRRHYNKNRQKKSQQKRASYLRIKDKVFNYYGGYVCSCCGETEKSMLTIDHKNNDGSKHRRELKLRWSMTMYNWIIKNNYPDTFQVLCYNCNISKFRNNGVCAHKLNEGSTTIPKGSRAKRLEVQSSTNCG